MTAEPVTGELPKPTFLSVGETPIYLSSPLEVNGQQVTQLTIKGTAKRAAGGIDSAVILLEEPSRRRGEEGQKFLKPLTNLNEMEEVDWNKVGGIRYAMPDGSLHTIAKNQLSLEKPALDQSKATPAPSTPDVSAVAPVEAGTKAEPKLARTILESYNAPKSLTIVGLKAYEVRAHDLADRAMQGALNHRQRDRYDGAKELWEQTKDTLHTMRDMKRTIWKHSIGHTYFHERARLYYTDMLKTANSPFALQSIRVAEAAAQNRYQELLKNSDFLSRAGRRFVEYAKDSLGMRTITQRFALEEIGRMREAGQIVEMEAFEREGKALRLRFEQDFDAQDTFVRKALGEKLTILSPDNPEHKQVASDIKLLVKAYATGDIKTKEEFDRATQKFFETHLKDSRPDIFGQAELYSSSLYDVAETIRTRASHDAGVAAIDAQLASMEVRLGMGVMGEATQLEPTDVSRGTQTVNRLVNWMEKKGVIGPFLFNEVTISTGVALALTLGAIPKSLLSTQARLWGGFGAGAAAGAIFGGLKEYRMLNKEYLTHIRQREAGLSFKPSDRRRAWMERFFVGQRSADGLVASIRNPIYAPDGKTLRDSLSHDQLRMAIGNLADAKARSALSERRVGKRVGLIQFRGLENIETQRTALDLTIAQAQKDLETYFATHDTAQAILGGRSFAEFIDVATNAQGLVINDGVRRLDGLDDPVKVTLGILEKYNPEIDVMRRRFPLLGPEGRTGVKAQGLEEIFKEFRRAARGAAVRRGLEVGLSGAVIGLGIREGLNLGFEAVSKLQELPPVFSPKIDVNPGQSFVFSDNLHMDAGNLVDKNGHVIVAGLKDYLAQSHGALSPDGTMSESAKHFISEQARAHGYGLEFPDAVKSTFEFSQGPHTLADLTSGQPIEAPQELHWVFTPAGRQLVLDFKDGHNNILQQVLYSDSAHQGEPSAGLAGVMKHSLLKYDPEQHIEKAISLDKIHIPKLAEILDASGAHHALGAQIPDGTHLVQTGVLPTGDHVYNLVDAGNHPLLHNIRVNELGKITNLAALNKSTEALGNHLKLSQIAEKPIDVPGGSANGVFDKTVRDMGAEHGANGPWGWLEQSIAKDTSVQHNLPATNLAKNLFRGTYEKFYHAKDHVTGPFRWDVPDDKVNYNAMQPDAVFHDVPKALFSDTQLGKLGHIMDRAIELKEINHVDFSHMPSPAELAKLGLSQKDFEIFKAAYEIGRVGRVATGNEVKMFIDYMGGGTKVVTPFQPIIHQSMFETIPGRITGIPESQVWNVIALPTHPAVPEIPLIPIPLIGRLPLEAPVLHAFPGVLPADFTPPTYFTYGGEQTFLTGDEYSGRRSPRLTEKSDTVLNADEEISWYLSTLTAEDKQDLEPLLAQYHAPVGHEVRAVVSIPANKEGMNIFQTLEQYAKQKDLRGNPLDPSSYEIVVYDNRTAKQTADTTHEEVMRFGAEHPQVNIVYLSHVFPSRPTIGRVRRNLTNFVMKRLATMPPGTPDVAIISNDADSVDISDTYLATIMSSFEDNPRLDAIAGRYDFPEEAYKNYPVLFATERAWQLMDAIVRYNEQKGIPQLMGANSAVRAGSLAAIGGYNPKSPLGEDLEIGWMIQTARKSDPSRFLYLNALKLSTDPRRVIYKYLQGAGLLDRYADFADNEEVRGLSWQELATRAQESYSRENLEKSLTRIRNELYPWLQKWNPEGRDRYFKRTMDFLGVEFEIRNDAVTILDDSVLRAGINAELTPEQVVKQLETEKEGASSPAGTPPNPPTVSS